MCRVLRESEISNTRVDGCISSTAGQSERESNEATLNYNIHDGYKSTSLFNRELKYCHLKRINQHLFYQLLPLFCLPCPYLPLSH